MRVLDRLVFRELVVPFLVGTIAVTMMLVGNMLFYYAEPFFQRGVPLVIVAQMVVFHTPALLVLTLPVGTALAVSLAVNRLSRDSELVVMRGAGISLYRVFLPILLFGLAVSVANFLLGEHVVPPAEARFRQLRDRTLLMQNSPLLRSGVVFKVQQYAFYLGSVAEVDADRTEMRDVLVMESPPTGYPRVITAERADYADGLWTLYNAHVHVYGRDGRAVDAHAAGSVKINLRVALANLVSTPAPEETTAAEIRKQALAAQAAGIHDVRLWIEYHFKFAIPFACMVFALCAMPLAMAFSRAGSFMGVLLAIVLVFVFWNTLLLFKVLGNQGLMAPWIAAWIPNALFAVGGIALLWRAE